MDSRFKQLKNCDKKSKRVINGYIHDIQKLFPHKKNSYYIIPELINLICLSFYWVGARFNKENHGEHIEFVKHISAVLK